MLSQSEIDMQKIKEREKHALDEFSRQASERRIIAENEAAHKTVEVTRFRLASIVEKQLAQSLGSLDPEITKLVGGLDLENLELLLEVLLEPSETGVLEEWLKKQGLT